MNIYTYTAFKKEFVKLFSANLPKPYCDYEIEIQKIGKNNGMREAVCVHTDECIPSPVTYLDDAFHRYLACQDIDCTVQLMVEDFISGVEYVQQLGSGFLFPKAEDIVYVLVNAEKNKELLQTVPHRMFMDLALIYRFIMIVGPEQNVHSAVVNDGYMEANNYTEEDLFQIAKKNTPEMFPLDIKHIIGEFIAVTNKHCMFGATALIYDGVLQELADEIGGDYFIIPSSIHEVFIMPDRGQDVEDLCSIISQANQDVCEKDEILGERPYRYIYETGEIEVL